MSCVARGIRIQRNKRKIHVSRMNMSRIFQELMVYNLVELGMEIFKTATTVDFSWISDISSHIKRQR